MWNYIISGNLIIRIKENQEEKPIVVTPTYIIEKMHSYSIEEFFYFLYTHLFIHYPDIIFDFY